MGGGYTLGVSTGLFSIARSAEPETRQEYVGLPKKALWSITKGVNFAQVDLESISEFKEPGIETQVKALEKIGVSMGIHGEAREYTQTLPFLDTALYEEWHRSHNRLIECLKGAGYVKAKYFLLHSSASTSWQLLWRDLQPTRLADIWGRSLSKFLDENTDVLEWAAGDKQDYVTDVIRGLRDKNSLAYDLAREMQNDWMVRNPGKEPDEAAVKKMQNQAKETANRQYTSYIKQFVGSSNETYGSERIAYFMIAKWMQDGDNCPKQLREIWKEITGGGNIDDQAFRESDGGSRWVPAVTAAYTWGHFNPQCCPSWKDSTRFEDPKPILAKNDLWFLLETPMTGAGEEEQMRLGRPLHIYYLVKHLGTPKAGIVFDAEHQLSGGIDPQEQAAILPDGAGRFVKAIHAGYPAVLAPAHIPIPLGSEAQEYVYELIWKLRKKGFKEGWIIFERGSGTEPVRETILALRKVMEYLERDVPPKDLPDDFYGLKKGEARLTRQEVAIKDHAMDPLKGMLIIPEEEYSFLSTAAAAKGKLEEWKKEELK